MLAILHGNSQQYPKLWVSSNHYNCNICSDSLIKPTLWHLHTSWFRILLYLLQVGLICLIYLNLGPSFEVNIFYGYICEFKATWKTKSDNSYLYSPTIIVTGIAAGTPIIAQISFGLSISAIAAMPASMVSNTCSQDWIEVNLLIVMNELPKLRMSADFFCK